MGKPGLEELAVNSDSESKIFAQFAASFNRFGKPISGVEGASQVAHNPLKIGLQMSLDRGELNLQKSQMNSNSRSLTCDSCSIQRPKRQIELKNGLPCPKRF
ncbi:hypothetical protein DM860_017006 [Cuscuta australis]|uniref:Uncharacterized protein n=1 Tax=Cuscuta australis TaxID=267555 RepID=A0A328DSS1_9ASTE|nr:hypothetical protein DM860_017006 [Cuscuta australis]